MTPDELVSQLAREGVQAPPTFEELLRQLSLADLAAFTAKWEALPMCREILDSAGLHGRMDLMDILTTGMDMRYTDAERLAMRDELHYLLSEASAGASLAEKAVVHSSECPSAEECMCAEARAGGTAEAYPTPHSTAPHTPAQEFERDRLGVDRAEIARGVLR